MTRLQQLKNEARKAEQRSDWARAIELYKDAIQRGEDSGSSADAGMYNRVGDLYLRQGDPTSAVEYYQEAADRYAATGLHTSAIALCNKILRIAPDQDDVYGRLARLHASTGLLAEARSAFLQFSERMRTRNRLSEALEAVQDLVNLTGDEELRTAFADQLAKAGLAAQAVAQLRLVYEARVAGGRNAQDIRERIRELDPDADPVAGPAPAPPRATTTPAPSAPPSAPPVPAESGDVSMEELLGMHSALGNDAPPAEPAPTPSSSPPELPSEVTPAESAGMESVLARFRSQVRDIVEETDYAVHYDLGVAYMGMELLEEAIGEFQLAIQSPAQIEAANALLGECLRRKASLGDGGGDVFDRSGPSPESPSSGPAPDLELPVAESHETALETENERTSSAVPDDSDDLANMLFQARLAQHRVRKAADEGRVDHEAHFELGRTYQEMGLHAEAVDDLVTATAGPRAVAEGALAALESLSLGEAVDPVPVREALKCLVSHGRTDAAEAAARAFVTRPGVGNADRQAVLDALPAGSLLVTPQATTREPGPPDSETLDDLEDIMAELEGAAENEAEAGAEDEDEVPPVAAPATPGTHRNPAALFGEAEGLREAGRMDEAASYYYRALELYEKDRDALSALRVVERLLGLRPDDVVLHHQKTEFAIMTNDRDLLISAYLDLASCLRRQNALRSARTIYGRILDLDPGNAEARAGIAALDAEELTLERQRRARPKEATQPSAADALPAEPSAVSPVVEPVAADFDEMFDEIRQHDDAQAPDYESHYELGIAFRQMQMWDEAAREFKLAVQGMSEPLPAYEMLGEALINLRRYEEARRTLSTAVARPGEADAAKSGILFHLGVAHLRAGDPAEARVCLERVVRLNPSRSDAAQLLSTLSR